MRTLDHIAEQTLAGLAEAGRLRKLRAIEPLAAGRVRIAGREVVNFSSNDYLGLSRHPLLIERARQWTALYGAGSAASRLVTGHLAAIEQVEAKIAAGKQTEAALIFASGWQCNASVLPALLDRDLWGAQPKLFADKLNHASLHMGANAAGARQIRYRHDDMDHLARLLEQHDATPGPSLIVTETVFSMDGDATAMDRLMAVAARHDALVYVDEAHATGVLGATGFGLSPGLGVDISMGTFSKGLGGFGAYVACSRAVRALLVNRASGLIYATALPPAVLGAMDAALDLIPTLEAERRRLAERAEHVRAEFRRLGLDTGASATQIIPVILGDERRTLAVARALEDKGILGIAIRPPTVPPGTSRIRFALSAAHADADLDRLIEATAQAVKECP